MSTVVVSVEVQGSTAVTAKAGTVMAGMKITLSNGAVAQVVASAPYTASFSDVAPGSYTSTAQFVDANGNALGPVFTSGSITVEPDVSIEVPNIVNATLTVQ